MKAYFTIISWFITFSALHCQTTFEFHRTNPMDEISRSIIEDGEGNIYFPVENFQYALIVKLSNEGDLLDSIQIINPNGTCNIGEFIRYDEDHFIALGYWSSDSTSELWYVLFDNNLQLIEDKKIDSVSGMVYDFKHIILINSIKA